MYAPSLISPLMIFLGLLLLSAGCMSPVPGQSTTGAQVAGTPAEIVVLPEPTNTSPALPEPTGTDPYVLTLTAQPTFPPPPDPEMLTRSAAASPDTPLVTATPLVIDKVINLAEGLPDGEIHVVIVHRADGTNEQYLVPWAPLGETTSYDEFVALQNQMVGITEQDTLIDSYALATPFPRMAPPPPDLTIEPVATAAEPSK